MATKKSKKSKKMHPNRRKANDSGEVKTNSREYREAQAADKVNWDAADESDEIMGDEEARAVAERLESDGQFAAWVDTYRKKIQNGKIRALKEQARQLGLKLVSQDDEGTPVRAPRVASGKSGGRQASAETEELKARILDTLRDHGGWLRSTELTKRLDLEKAPSIILRRLVDNGDLKKKGYRRKTEYKAS